MTPVHGPPSPQRRPLTDSTSDHREADPTSHCPGFSTVIRGKLRPRQLCGWQLIIFSTRILSLHIKIQNPTATMLINCPECKRQVSSNAATCPNCGSPIRPAQLSHDERLSRVAQEVGKALAFGPRCPYCNTYSVRDLDASARGRIFGSGGLIKAFAGTKECTSCGKVW
jgi:uncharacterized protein with PIN domain